MCTILHEMRLHISCVVLSKKNRESEYCSNTAISLLLVFINLSNLGRLNPQTALIVADAVYNNY